MKIYLITDNEGLYKIGRSKNTQIRLKAVQTGNPRQLTLLHEVDVKNQKTEGVLHRRFASKCTSGEWFQLDSEDVQNFVHECQKIDSQLSFLVENSTLGHLISE